MTKVDLRELKAIVEALLDKAIEVSGDGSLHIPDEQDYYWDIPYKELFSVAARPAQMDIGRLSDDWEFLRPLLLDKQQVFNLMFIHAAPLLRFIGDKSTD